ncbi:MAG: type II toxin-antitoxin system RelE/ParE family toxin [Spongiibacteraceae bacterium]|nr:type II toxin-antitoxin system RelE/ParE family toxin [Spongiibacteraceae bacterium]
MKVVWTARAGSRLQDILEYIAKDQPVNAEKWVDQLIERGDSLSEYPSRGRMVPEYQDPAIREVFEGDYRIIYWLLVSRVDILTVLHGSIPLPVRLNDLK